MPLKFSGHAIVQRKKVLFFIIKSHLPKTGVIPKENFSSTTC